MRRLLHAQVSEGDALPPLVMDMTSTRIVAGALASRDYAPLHHDYHYATDEAGHRDIFMNTFHQAALFERYLDDWAGARGRLGRMKFRMSASVYAGDSVAVNGEVTGQLVDDSGCGWVALRLTLSVDSKACTECEVRYALPLTPGDNPWERRGEQWRP